jgi:glutamate transport system substrate-binding protein
VVIVLLVAVAFVVGVTIVDAQLAPTEADLRDEAGLTGKRELLVGVIDDQPGVSEWDSQAGRYVGFDIDMAYLIAGELRFRPSEVRFLPLESEDRARMQARTPDGNFVRVDLVVATFSITKDREDRPDVTFSAPYLLTEQSVVTLRGHSAVQQLADLRDRPVCSITTATSESPAKIAGVRLTSKNKISECIQGLLDGKFEAVTTDAAILAGFVTRDRSRLTHHDIGLAENEAWGVNTGGNEALRKLVNLALYRSYDDPNDRRWEDAFDRHLRPLQRDNLPQQVAEAAQPRADRPQVRRMPWEE